MFSTIKQFLRGLGSGRGPRALTREEFGELFSKNLLACRWEPHPRYSVFTQYDQEHYLAEREDFMHKYRCFYALSKTIGPKSIIEMGTSAGAGADAYLSAAPGASYWGLDVFCVAYRHDDGSAWDPYRIAQALFKERGFRRWQLVRGDLREIKRLPDRADLVVVDAAHDFENEYEDLRLALTAHPSYIFVDDAKEEAKPAVEKFLTEDVKDMVEFTFPINYVGGGLVIKLKDGANA